MSGKRDAADVAARELIGKGWTSGKLLAHKDECGDPVITGIIAARMAEIEGGS